MNDVRVVIAEDEPHARRLLRTMLTDRGGVDIVAEAADGREAVQAITQHDPDLVFLDVQMPELDGFGVVETIGPDRMPAVVFVTAFDQYAVRAFDVNAFDYLLKPFDRQRLDRAVDRAIERLRAAAPSDLGGRLQALLTQIGVTGRAPAVNLPVRTEHGFRFVEIATIEWIEASGKRLKVHAGREVHVLRQTMGAMEDRLDPGVFMRVHRSAIVNVRRIREIQPWFQGEYVIILADGTKVTTGRSYRANVRRLLEGGASAWQGTPTPRPC